MIHRQFPCVQGCSACHDKRKKANYIMLNQPAEASAGSPLNSGIFETPVLFFFE
jgi:hypothetical protein